MQGSASAAAHGAAHWDTSGAQVVNYPRAVADVVLNPTTVVQVLGSRTGSRATVEQLSSDGAMARGAAPAGTCASRRGRGVQREVRIAEIRIFRHQFARDDVAHDAAHDLLARE